MTLFARRSWVRWSLLAAACWCWLGAAESVLAAKPGGGGSTAHTGLIYFVANQQAEHWGPYDTWQMYEDGSGKQLALPAGRQGVPTSKLYGGARWWIVKDFDPLTDSPELFAIRANGSERVQLTALGAGGITLDWNMAWSNDGQDTFVSFTGITTRNGVEGQYLFRLPIVGDIHAMRALGVLPFLAEDCEEVLPPQRGGSPMHSWSPDGQALAYLSFDDPDGSLWKDTSIHVRVPGDPPTDVPVYTADDIRQPKWSPDGTKIAFAKWEAGGASIWTMNADGTRVTRVLSSGSNTEHLLSGWSWDSKELMLTSRNKYDPIGSNRYHLVRMPAGGGKLTILTRDLLPAGQKQLVKWLPIAP